MPRLVEVLLELHRGWDQLELFTLVRLLTSSISAVSSSMMMKRWLVAVKANLVVGGDDGGVAGRCGSGPAMAFRSLGGPKNIITALISDLAQNAIAKSQSKK